MARPRPRGALAPALALGWAPALALGWVLLGGTSAGAQALLGPAGAATGIAVEAPPGRRLLVATPFGALVVEAGEARWICAAAVAGGVGPGAIRARFRISRSGTWFAALPGGLFLSRNGGCDWRPARGPLGDAWVEDVAESPADPRLVYAVTSTSGRPNGLFVSHDDGASWAPAAPLDPVAFYRRVVPDERGATVSGYDQAPPTGHPHLWRYQGGVLGGLAAVGLAETAGGRIADLFGVFSRRPGLLGLAALGKSGAIFQSDDDGRHVARRLAVDDLEAALLDESDHLWLATGHGLFRAESPPLRFEGAYGCLAARGSEVYACPSDARGPLVVAVGPDGRLRPLLGREGIAGPLVCPAGSLVAETCGPLWASLAGQLGRPPAPGGAAPPGEGGCSPGAGFALGTVVLVGLAFLGALLRGRAAVSPGRPRAEAPPAGRRPGPS